MDASTTVNFWDRLWRSSGIIFGIFFVVAYLFYGLQPKIGASADTLVSFYDGHRMRILMATMLFGWAVLFLLWFAAAIRSVLHDAGQGGWGAAATASGAALGGMLWGLIAVGAALAYSIVGLGNDALTSGLNDIVWAGIVVSSLPRAILIMAGTFGLWRAKLISNALFGAGVAAILLVLVGCTTWASNGIWAPSGDYTRYVSPVVGLVWIVVFSGVLLTRRSPSATPQAPEPPAAAPASLFAKRSVALRGRAPSHGFRRKQKVGRCSWTYLPRAPRGNLGGVEGVPGPVPRRRGRGAGDPRKERAYLSQPAPQVPNPKGSSEPRPTEQRRSS